MLEMLEEVYSSNESIFTGILINAGFPKILFFTLSCLS